MSNVIEFPEIGDPCLCCNDDDVLGKTIYLHVNGPKNPPKHYMLCGKCASRHAAECCAFVEELMRTNQLVENVEED